MSSSFRGATRPKPSLKRSGYCTVSENWRGYPSSVTYIRFNWDYATGIQDPISENSYLVAHSFGGEFENIPFTFDVQDLSGGEFNLE